MRFGWNNYNLQTINDMELDDVMSKENADWVRHECEILELAAERSSVAYINMIKTKIEANAEIHVHDWLF